ncbi:uncharacterized protein DUF4286 [Algoriphagus boseongensis]|uniref:Uncharacterized protein DUF4286 n=1 Tax=Algoriphagus boseongensis TaxID=1442587 RepID=A0A4R6T5W6_9BACT|nr:DUF4286 family protein [Algoriphagus boseongensis]TDQ16926.1 uncharacterized protein DUF4286 [Algoriphagus boseongensis]
MILYNITINVTPDIEEDFISWMKSIHIPEVLETGIFHDHKFFRLLHDSEDGSTNYCIQYFTESIEKMMEYEKRHAVLLRSKTQERYKDKAVAFRTLLETI